MRQAEADSNCIGIEFTVQHWGRAGKTNIVSQYINRVRKSIPSK